MTINEIVEKGYDKIAQSYYANRDLNKFNGELDKFIKLLPLNAHVLDVGCGAGIPTAKYLTERGIKVTGIDISTTMINLARENTPEATFIKMDINDIRFDEDSFDGLISVYTLFHIPRKNHLKIFKRFYEILKQGGVLVINTGVSESEGMSNFFGVQMFWSNYNPEKTLKLVKEGGFSILFEGILQRGGEFQYWIFGIK
ncbi:MAG: methyltransferase domain-containing protein [Candidatus Lokiarchaeota archaeon]|nr:methyltransferase domain-containing protein [Candidatus Lokiarchaeota archaeon]